MRTVKAKRLLKALSNESVRRLPYIFFVLIVLSFIQFTRLSVQTAHSVQIASANALDSKTLLKRVAQLSEDNKSLITQNKELTEQNIQIANDNSQHLDCLADLFARYTRDQTPILKADLSTCMVITSQGSSQKTSTNSKTASPSVSPSQSVPAVSSSSNTTPTQQQSLPDTSQQPAPKPRPLLCSITLGIFGCK